jgi:hypothetical protein
MKGVRMSRKEDDLNTAIQSVMDTMAMYGPDSEEYPKLVQMLEKLTALKKPRRWWRLDPNTLLLVLGNLFGILIIVVVEQQAAWRSKATDFIIKTKTTP